jgi:hypothetical protein
MEESISALNPLSGMLILKQTILFPLSGLN